MAAIGLIIIFTLIAFLETPLMIRDKLWKELTVYYFFLLGGFVLSLLMVLGVELPFIAAVITKVIKSLLLF